MAYMPADDWLWMSVCVAAHTYGSVQTIEGDVDIKQFGNFGAGTICNIEPMRPFIGF
jgi:hypothetical protein